MVAELTIALCLIVIITGDWRRVNNRSNDLPKPTHELQPPKALAGVAESVITIEKIESAMRQSRSTNVSAMVDRLLDQEVLYAAACRAGVDIEPEVAAAVRRLVASTYLQRLNVEDVSLTEAELLAWYRKNKQLYYKPERRSAAVIRISGSSTADVEQSARTDARIKSIRSLIGECKDLDFGRLAATSSDHQGSRFKGGRIGWVAKEDKSVPSEVISTLFLIESKQGVAEPVLVGNDCWFVKLIDRQESGVLPFESVRERVKYKAEREASLRRRRQIMEALRKQTNAWVDADEVEKFNDSYQKRSVSPKAAPVNQLPEIVHE